MLEEKDTRIGRENLIINQRTKLGQGGMGTRRHYLMGAQSSRLMVFVLPARQFLLCLTQLEAVQTLKLLCGRRRKCAL